MFTKKLFVALVSSAMLVSSLPAEAAFGKAATSSSSTSSTSNTKAAIGSISSSPSSGNKSASKGVSGGQSLGMSRSTVANNVKSGNYTAPANGTTVAGKNPGGTTTSNNNYGPAANSPNYNSGYNNGYAQGGYGQPQAAPSTGHSTGTVLGAAAVAGAAGYMLGNSNSNNHQNQPVIINNGTNGNGYNNGGNGYNNGGYAGPAPTYNNGTPAPSYDNGISNTGAYANAVPARAPSGGGVGSFIWSLIKILLGLIVLYFIVKFIMAQFRKNQATSPTPSTNFGANVFNTKTPEDQIRDIKEQFFVDFQKNNRPSGIDYIRSQSEPIFFDAVVDMVKEASDTRVVRVKQLEAELVDITQDGSRYIASVRYKAHVVEGEPGEDGVDTPINELWNFVYSNGNWKLAGIDQL